MDAELSPPALQRVNFGRPVGDDEFSEAAAFAHRAQLGQGEQLRYDAWRELPKAGLKVLDQVGSAGIARSHVVFVDGLLHQRSPGHERVDGGRGRVGLPKQRLAVDLAQEPLASLDARVGPDHLQVEHCPAWTHRLDHVPEDVHDVLRLHSSERPREEHEFERAGRDLELLAGRDPVLDAVRKFPGQRPARVLDLLGIRIEGEHACRVRGDADGEPTVAAAELEDALTAEVGQAPQGGEVTAFRIEGSHGL